MSLSSVSLLEHTMCEDGAPGITVHRLVQAAMRVRIKGRDEEDTYVALATRRLMEAFPENAYDEIGNWPRCAALLPHVMALREYGRARADGMEFAGKLLNSSGAYLLGRGAYGDAEPLYREAIQLRAKALGHDHPDTAVSLNDLAHLLTRTGRTAEAEPLYHEAIRIGEEVLGREHPSVAVRLANLASTKRLRHCAPAMLSRSQRRNLPPETLKIGCNPSVRFESIVDLDAAIKLVRLVLHASSLSFSLPP